MLSFFKIYIYICGKYRQVVSFRDTSESWDNYLSGGADVTFVGE